jgi:hypothetical protein
MSIFKKEIKEPLLNEGGDDSGKKKIDGFWIRSNSQAWT